MIGTKGNEKLLSDNFSIPKISRDEYVALVDAPEQNSPQEDAYYSYGNYRKPSFYTVRGRRAVRYRGRGNIRGQKFKA